MAQYAYAGLLIGSDVPLPELTAAGLNEGTRPPALSFSMLEVPPANPAARAWIHEWHGPSGEVVLALAAAGGEYLLRFPDLADFVVSSDRCSVRAWPVPGTTPETVRHLLLDQVLPRVIADRGGLVLHASAVQIGGQAVALVGETGAGKSTLAAGLHASGHRLLTDDSLVVRPSPEGVSALPTYPSLRLWPEAVNALFGDRPGLAQVAHYSCKRRVPVGAETPSDPVPLAAVFVLRTSHHRRGRAAVARLSPRDAWLALIRQSFQLDVTDPERATQLLEAAGAVVERMPVLELLYPRGFPRLSAACSLVVEHVRSRPLPGGRPPAGPAGYNSLANRSPMP